MSDKSYSRKISFYGTSAERLIAECLSRKMGRADLQIASIALAKHATLVTRNIKDFQRVPNLKIVNWLD